MPLATMSQTALITNKPGEPLVAISRSVPAPGPKEGSVKNHAHETRSVNPHDRKIRDLGFIVPLEEFPCIPGHDMAGVVEAVGAGATNVKVGDRVLTQAASTSHDTSGLQEHTITSYALLAKILASMTFGKAATLPICVPSVFTALFPSTGLGLPLLDNIAGFDYPSKTILLARLVGFGSIVTVASKNPEKEAKLKQLGATVVVDRHSPSLQEDVRAAVVDNLLYAVETVGQGQNAHTLGVSALSNNAKGTLVTITHDTVDESVIGEKRAGYEKRFTVGSSHVYPEFGKKVWPELPKWIRPHCAFFVQNHQRS
ncbi:hypothetical protein LLEC1_02570 [Akanthomyces lecanii]|uniref:Uncharacterized protein n=1 Tax=Cordyceps confragosa TaxID=2714763 RepID=A0A179I8S8_CORDF|nr:hypothetical protein LLEC1_02570 [Akanthomyces lecanii]